MAEIEISREYILAAMQHQVVTGQMRAVAERVAARARTLAAADEMDLEIDIGQFIRPGGRPVANVIAEDAADQEWGTAKTPRRRILGRAAEDSA